jgi:hypothetical protein
MMNTLKKQQGLSMWSWLLILIIAGFFLICAFKIVPLYAENRYIESALKSLVEPGTTLDSMTDVEIKRKLTNFYTINNVRSEGANKIIIKRDAKRVMVTIDYEARVTLFDDVPVLRTVDVVVKFENHLDSSLPKFCCRPVKSTSETN